MDKTTNKRQNKRVQSLNQIANQGGWQSWSSYETAVINGRIEIGKSDVYGNPYFTRTQSMPLADYHKFLDTMRERGWEAEPGYWRKDGKLYNMFDPEHAKYIASLMDEIVGG